MDKRWNELGDLLVNYSMKIESGEKVMIAMKELDSFPLTCAIYEAVIKAGGYPQVQFISEELNRLILQYGSWDQINWIPEIEMMGMDWADVYFGLRSPHNFDVHLDISSEKLAAHRRSMGIVSTARWEKTRWCLVCLPNVLLAERAKVDEETFKNIWFNACLQDWSKLSKTWQKWAEKLNKGKTIHILAKGTDLTFSVEGRKWIVEDGIINMPDGEIATAPVTNSVNGFISFDLPASMSGRLVEDIYLEWMNGKMVKATSKTNQDFLHDILNVDEGAKKIGEFAFGTNDKLDCFCREILIDEKIGGTIHIALGRAYPECGGKNQSSIHWDIVKDMRDEGKIYLDEKLIYQKGKMLL